MTKAELIAAISEKTDLTKIQMETVLNATFETIAELIAKQEKITIPGFGGFQAKVRKERKGRNPSTGKEIIIPQSMVASFKPALQLKAALNHK